MVVYIKTCFRLNDKIDRLDQNKNRPLRHRHTSLDSGTYRVKGKSPTTPILDQLKTFDKTSSAKDNRPSRDSHVPVGGSHVTVKTPTSSETEKRRDISPVWIERRRCCSANQTRRVVEYAGSASSGSSPGDEGSKLTPSSYSRTLWFVPLSSSDKNKKIAEKETPTSRGNATSPEVSPGTSKTSNSMFSKSETHLQSPDTSVSGKPPSSNRASLRLKKHKLRNNTFTYSKYLAQKDKSETDLITTRSSVSLNSWPDETSPGDSSPLPISDVKDKVGKCDKKPRSDTYVAESFGDTFITFDASDMEERSAKKDTTHPLNSSSTTTITVEDKTDRHKLLDKYRNKNPPTNDTRPSSPGVRKFTGGRKSPGDKLSSRSRNKSPGSASSSTTDLFMKVSSSLSRRLSLNRKHKKSSAVPETTSQIDIEKYLYGKDSGVYSKEIELDYTDLNYTVNNYSRL